MWQNAASVVAEFFHWLLIRMQVRKTNMSSSGRAMYLQPFLKGIAM